MGCFRDVLGEFGDVGRHGADVYADDGGRREGGEVGGEQGLVASGVEETVEAGVDVLC